MLPLRPINTLLQTSKILRDEKNYFICISFDIRLYTLKAQEPDVIFRAERAFEFRLPGSSLWIQCELYEPKLSCTKHRIAQWFSTTNAYTHKIVKD
jgi:hypothetical protein